MNRRTRKIPEWIRDYPSLIQWLIDTVHDGVEFQMSKRLGRSSALVPQWKKEKTKVPRGQNISMLCKEYNLDEDEVHSIISKRRSRAIPREVVDLKSLVSWIAKEHHESWAAMAKRVGVSEALVSSQWRGGLVQQPKPQNLERLCNEYALDIAKVRARLR